MNKTVGKRKLSILNFFLGVATLVGVIGILSWAVGFFTIWIILLVIVLSFLAKPNAK